MKTAPLSSATSLRVRSLSSGALPEKTILAPYPRTASTFTRGASPRHHDAGVDPADPRRKGERLRVVSRGMGDHAAARLGFLQGKHRVHRAPELECSHALEVLALEKEACRR